MRRWRQVPLLLALLGAGAPSAAADRPLIALCGAEDQPTAQLAAAMEPFLARVCVVDGGFCDPGDGPAWRVRFAGDGTGAVVLVIEESRSGGASRQARVAWLDCAEGAIGETLRGGKAGALSLILEGLAMDFQGLMLDALPDLDPDPEPEPEPEPEAEPEQEEARIARRSFEAGVGAGAVYLPPDVFAPRLALFAALAIERWAVLLFGGFSFDSNFEVDGRPFETRVVFVGLAARFAIVPGERGGLFVESGVGWFQNSYARSDIARAETRRWSDLGLVAGLMGRLRVAGPLAAFARLGVEVYPTARRAQIDGGPDAETPVTGIPVLAGLELVFADRR